MEFIKRYWLQIKAFLVELPPTTMWLILSLVVIMVMIGGFLMIYASGSSMVPVSPFATEKQPEVVSRLRAAGIKVQTRNGQIMVPDDKLTDALLILQQGELLDTDFSSAFDELASKQSMWLSSKDKEQNLLLARQKVLGQFIAKMNGVQSAQVIISMPKERGFGATHVRPSASVSVLMQKGRRVDKPLVDAIAGWVRGAVAEMRPQDVTVIDANLGRVFTVADKDDVIPGEMMAQVAQLELYHRNKIMEVLGYIPGVIVAVNVRTDPVLRREIRTVAYQEKQGIEREFARETSSRDVQRAGEPGVRSNTQLNIEAGGSAGRSEQTSETETIFRPQNVTEETRATAIGRGEKQINVTVNIPRSYFVNVWRMGQQDRSAEPDDDALMPVVETHLARIESQIEPLLSAETKGIVRANMILDRESLERVAQAGTGTATIGTLVSSPMGGTIGVAALAVVALGMMFFLVRKATQQTTLPSVKELAGLPPVLPVEDELVGEAEEADAGMAGMELNDEQIRSRKMAEQIGDLVKNNPSEAAALFNRWIRKDD